MKAAYGVGLRAKKYKNDILRSIEKVIDRGIFLNGDENNKLKKTLNEFLGRGFVTLTASGHDALAIAIKGLNLKPTDEVIIPVNAYPVAFPAGQANVKLIPVDVDENGLLDISKLGPKISKHTKAIIAVHLYGLVLDIKRIKKMIKGRGIVLIEDCAQSFGVKPLGDISCFSFYPTKNLGTLGDGGALWTKDKKLHDYFQKALSYGESARYNSEFISGHSRLPEMQAAILNLYIKKLKTEEKLRQRIFKQYCHNLAKYKLESYIRVLVNGARDFYPHLFVIEAKKRDYLRKHLLQNGIESQIHYPYPIHLIKAFNHLGFKKGTFPMAEHLSKNILSLPFHPFLTVKQIEYIIKTIKRFYE